MGRAQAGRLGERQPDPILRPLAGCPARAGRRPSFAPSSEKDEEASPNKSGSKIDLRLGIECRYHDRCIFRQVRARFRAGLPIG